MYCGDKGSPNAETRRRSSAVRIRCLAGDLAAAKAKAEEAAKSVTKVGDALERAEKLSQKRAEVAGALAGQAVKVGAVAMAMRPAVNEARDFEHHLAKFGLTADKTSKDLDSLRLQLRVLEGQTNQSKESLLSGLDVLVGKGMKYEDAVAAIGAIGRASTATGASVEEMSQLAFSVMDNLKVKASELPAILDIMSQAGKEGGFELGDMAKFFPQLTASAQMLGLKGSEAVSSMAAALQIAMKGASDPSTAANNMANFMAKIAAPETVEHFKKFGIDLKGALDQGMAAGDNPIETVLELIDRATEGGDRFKLGQLFGDMQVQNFLAPMLQNMKEYEEIKKKAGKASGVVDNDFAVMMKTNKEASKGLDIAIGKAGESFGKVLLPAITPVVVGLTKVVNVSADLMESYPTLTAVVVGAGAAWMTYRSIMMGVTLIKTTLALRSALAASSVVGLAGAQNVAAASSARMGLASLLAGGRVGAMVPVIVGGMRAITVAMMTNPVGLIVGGIAIAAGLVIANWDKVSAFFQEIWEPVKPYWDGFITWVGAAVDKLLAPVRAVYDFFAGDDKGDKPPVKAGSADAAAVGDVAKVAKATGASAEDVAGAAAAAQNHAAGAVPTASAAARRASDQPAQAAGGGDMIINMPITINGAGLNAEQVVALIVQKFEEMKRRAASERRGALFDHG